MEQFLIARGCDAGDMTLNRKVQIHLKLIIHDILDMKAVESLVIKWTQFQSDNKAEVESNINQEVEIKAFLEVNSKGTRVTDAQAYLIDKVRKFVAAEKPTSLAVVVTRYLQYVYETQVACRVAWSCGYRVRDAPIGKRSAETAGLYGYTTEYSNKSGYGKKGSSSNDHKGPSYSAAKSTTSNLKQGGTAHLSGTTSKKK
jgi:hypothetical protein